MSIPSQPLTSLRVLSQPEPERWGNLPPPPAPNFLHYGLYSVKCKLNSAVNGSWMYSLYSKSFQYLILITPVFLSMPLPYISCWVCSVQYILKCLKCSLYILHCWELFPYIPDLWRIFNLPKVKSQSVSGEILIFFSNTKLLQTN